MEIEASGSGNAGDAGSSGATAQLGKDDFLKLLIAQMQQQDPLNPADGAQFLAQLAQFTNLEQMVQINAKLDTLAMAQASLSSTAVASLIGHTVTVRGDAVELVEGEQPALHFEMESNVESCTVTIRDQDGRVVRTMELGGCQAGSNEVIWDGCDDDGNRLPAGSYTFSVNGTDAQGRQVEGDGLVTGVVTGVSYDQGYPQLLLGQVRVSLGDVVEIL
ncbi:MAG: flagellar hook assembly protein FlgD [Deltaproteobacteria bacterium]|nr:MAG: flagellar hook assembly protein FlgD [Deltaproteobacteria bacterium]RLB76339.1 MAG: flagellar hook assembly protein FlgD [Deltaproteobacteria bacterium]